MKKKFKFLFLFFSFMFLRMNVYAENLDVKDIVNEYPNTNMAKLFEYMDEDTTLELDEKEKKINLISENEVVLFASYTEDYILYTDDSDDGEILGVAFFLEALMESSFNLLGYKDIAVANYDEFNYDIYGLDMEYVLGENESDFGYIKSFKISLDEDKLKKLAEDYGEPVTEDGKLDEEFKDLVPTVKFKDITTESLYLSAYVENFEFDEDNIPMCQFYRSTSIDGEYELVSEWMISCDGTGYIMDEGLLDNTTFYYKAKLVGSEKFGEPSKVTTLKDKSSNISNESEEDNVSNPDTGVYLFVFLVLGVISLLFIIYGFRKQQLV